MGLTDRWIIEDVSIASQNEDRFDHTSVAREIADIARKSTHSLAIGLLGRYGTGKSSVVRLLHQELNGRRWAVLQVSAERHTGVARGRGLLYGLIDEAHRQGDDVLSAGGRKALRAGLEGGQQRTTTVDVAEDRKSTTRWQKYAHAAGNGLAWMTALTVAVWLIGAVITAVVHRLHAWPHVKSWTWFTASGATAPTAFLLSSAVAATVIVAAKEGAQHVLRGYDITLTTPRADTADELEQAFLRLVRQVKRRVVVAIDDIDRLAADDVLDALSTVRSLLLVGAQLERPPVFLLSCDEEIVREAIIGVSPGLAHRPVHTAGDETEDERRAAAQAADEYLNKLFTVRIALPDHHGLDMREYAGQLLEKHPINTMMSTSTLETILDVLIHDRVSDPRHVIRLLNGFLAHYRLGQRREAAANGSTARIAEGEVTNYPVELARLTALQYDFRHLYDAVARERELLHLLDDAILVDAPLENADPLLNPYLATNGPGESTALPLDYEAHPGLVYLRTVAPTVRPHRAPEIGPLLTLGSEPDSRQLGGETARAIRSELHGRDTHGFAKRLLEPEGRGRVLQAAELVLADARHGLALDNAMTTAVSALGQTQNALSGGEARRLADIVVRRRSVMTIPLEPEHLAVLLALSSEALHPALIATLQQVPEDADRRRRWAATLLAFSQTPHGPDFAAVLDDYFTKATSDAENTDEDLDYWLDAWERNPDEALTTWPTSAYAFALSSAAHHHPRSGFSAVILTGASRHRWGRPVIVGLLDCLGDESQMRQVALELLHHVEIPADEWGNDEGAGQELLSPSTLAVRLADRVALGLREEQDDAEAGKAADLLRAWLPHWLATSNRTAIDLTIDALADTADTSMALAEASADLVPILPEPDVARYAAALAAKLTPQRDAAPTIDAALRTTLINFLHATKDSEEAATAEATTQVIASLTAGLEAEAPAGDFAHESLPYLLTTQQGSAHAPTLAMQVINAIPNQATPHALLLTSLLHQLFAIPTVRDQHLPQALTRVQQWISSAQAGPAMAFAARYADQPAVNDQWLAWIGQHWDALATAERDLVLSAAGRPELMPPHAAAQYLPALLLNHLLDVSADAPWESAPRLWAALNEDQRAQLLAAERGRCPELAVQAAESPMSLLFGALQRAGEDLENLLQLLRDAPEASDAVNQFIEELLHAPAWQPGPAEKAVAGIPDPTAAWSTALSAASEGRDGLHRAAHVIRALAEQHPDSVPETFVQDFAPLVHDCTDVDTAATLGHAVQPIRETARVVSRTLTGEHNTTKEQKERNSAFRRAAGIRR
ncbi:P-loop NTPase fold protein [Streptomyces sp. NPDC001795]|uniref:P-loop NTPase fold protein n=1 Tax=Streptomyces sp. NPDC001795 TaxID=3154525 RepID=UPI0033230A8D